MHVCAKNVPQPPPRFASDGSGGVGVLSGGQEAVVKTAWLESAKDRYLWSFRGCKSVVGKEGVGAVVLG